VQGGYVTFYGGYGFFLKEKILIANVAEKNILILVEEKK
jgi:TfoX/Sxy family transcriptional regulator of competence genes